MLVTFRQSRLQAVSSVQVIGLCGGQAALSF